MHVRFQVPTAVLVRIQVFCDVTLGNCFPLFLSRVSITFIFKYQGVQGSLDFSTLEDGGTTFVWNVRKHPVTLSRRTEFWRTVSWRRSRVSFEPMNNLAELVEGPTLHVSCHGQGTCCGLSDCQGQGTCCGLSDCQGQDTCCVLSGCLKGRTLVVVCLIVKDRTLVVFCLVVSRAGHLLCFVWISQGQDTCCVLSGCLKGRTLVVFCLVVSRAGHLLCFVWLSQGQDTCCVLSGCLGQDTCVLSGCLKGRTLVVICLVVSRAGHLLWFVCQSAITVTVELSGSQPSTWTFYLPKTKRWCRSTKVSKAPSAYVLGVKKLEI